MARAGLARNDLVGALGRIVGEDRVVVGAGALGVYASDWTGRFVGDPPCAVKPRTTADVRAVIAALVERRAPYLVQGGNTGLVAGATPLGGEVVISMEEFDTSVIVDSARGEIRAGAAATLRVVQDAALAAGLDYPVDFAARERATIGGSVATNAAGLRTLRYGRTAERMLGLEVVLANGSVLNAMDGESGDADRWALAQRLVGSEGIFGAITAVRLRLVAALKDRATGLVAVSSIEDAVGLANRARRELGELESFEFVEAEGVELLADQLNTQPPLAGRALVVIETASEARARPTLEAFLAQAKEARVWEVAGDHAERSAMWAWREDQADAIARVGVPHKFDVALDSAGVASLVRSCRALLRDVAPSARLVAFGHLAEGRLHLNVLGLDPDDRSVDDALFDLFRAEGASAVSEHGVGRTKAAEFAGTFGSDALGELVALKRAVDPFGLANPGVMLPLEVLEG